MKKKETQKRLSLVWVVLLLLIGFAACKKETFTQETTSDVNITDFLLQNPDQFSEFSKILQITEFDGFLAAYGTYTAFVPTNQALDAYVKSKGKSSVNEIPVADLKDLVRIHLVRDTIAAIFFNDGKLRTKTMFGQYLITGAQNTGGVTSVTINRQANLKQPDIRVGNGIIHVIDNVLKPERLTIAQMIEADDNYSIFEEALRATGLYDSLNVLPENVTDTTKRYHTVLAESDAVLKAAGIDSYDELFDTYSDTKNPKLINDSLHLFVAYHILPGLKYTPDIFKASSHATLAPLDVVTSKLVGTSLLINDDVFNGKPEPGSEMNRAVSDRTAANGVLHAMSKGYFIKVRSPTAVYWEVTDQPEFTSLNGIFRVTNKQSRNFAPGEIKDISWKTGSVKYVVAPELRQFYVFNNDFIQFASLRTNATANNWIEFKTPLLVKGRYKVWICFIRRGGGSGVSVSFNGQLLPRVISLTERLPAHVLVGNKWTWPAGVTPESLEILGKKITFSEYPYYSQNGQTIDYYRDNYGALAGTITVEKTDRHTIRLDATADASGDVQFDMIHFIPENEEQLWPKFNPNGAIIQKP